MRRISEATGLNIVMGGRFHLQASHPERLRKMNAANIADEIVQEAVEGVGDSGVRIGLIAEIGISADFTPQEEKSLRGAAQAQRRTGLPLMVHLLGSFRVAHRVIDVIGEEGGSLYQTVLCHMNPSGTDVEYQVALAERGAFLEYDMIGMDFWYDDQGVNCPSDTENARAIMGLIERGMLDNVLLSQDVFHQDDADSLWWFRLCVLAAALFATLAPPWCHRTADRHDDGDQSPSRFLC